MIPRQCPKCGGELVLARRSDEQGARLNARPSNYWRSSTCGGEFTAEQVRGKKRSKQVEAARPLDQRSVNRKGDDRSSSRMADEGCPNQTPSVQDATDILSREKEPKGDKGGPVTATLESAQQSKRVIANWKLTVIDRRLMWLQKQHPSAARQKLQLWALHPER